VEEVNRTLTRAAGALAVAAAAALSSPSARASLVFYEGFDYTTGAALNGQVNTSVEPDDGWTRAGSATAGEGITIAAGSLTSPAGASTGNRVLITNPNTARTQRLNFPGIASGTVWYSLTMNATNTGGLGDANTGIGAYFAGLTSLDTNGGVDSDTAPATGNISTRLQLRTDPTDAAALNIALSNTVATATGQFSAAKLAQSTDHFLIVSYEIVPGAGNDVARLWINPNAGTFDPITTPASLTVDNAVAGQADVVDVKAFFLRQSGGMPGNVNVDELRLGTAFTDVVPEPASLAAAAVGGLALLGRRRRRA
jgi:hypothetical protein